MAKEIKKMASQNDERYFNQLQKEFDEFGGKANKFMFEEYISTDDAVLDFGCGGGFLLQNLNCRQKIGVESNPAARMYCNNVTGIECFESLQSIADESVDVIVSSHRLENTVNPFEVVSTMYEKLRDGGKIIIVVPLENYRCSWVEGNANNHLYSFSPMNLGNIFQYSGFTDIRTEPVFHKWVPRYKVIARIFGLNFFHKLSWLYGELANNYCVQIRGIAKKKVQTQNTVRFPQQRYRSIPQYA